MNEKDSEMIRALEGRSVGKKEDFEVGTGEWCDHSFIPAKMMEWILENPHLVPEKYKNRRWAFRGEIVWIVGTELHQHGVFDSKWSAISPDFWTPDTSAVEVSEVTFADATGTSWLDAKGHFRELCPCGAGKGEGLPLPSYGSPGWEPH